MQRVTRFLAAVALGLPGATVATVATGGTLPLCALAAGMHHAALVVEHGNGGVLTTCVAFTADSITGEQLLASSGVEYATVAFAGSGRAVCQIDAEPASYPPGCWTASSPYWAFYVARQSHGWTSSGLGISSQTFRDGDAAGFRYEGQTDSSPPPSAAGVCPPPQAATPPPPHPSPPPPAAPAQTARATVAAGVQAATPSAAPSPSALATTPAPEATAAATPSVHRSGAPPLAAAGAGPLGWILALSAVLLLAAGLGYRLMRSR